MQNPVDMDRTSATSRPALRRLLPSLESHSDRPVLDGKNSDNAALLVNGHVKFPLGGFGRKRWEDGSV